MGAATTVASNANASNSTVLSATDAKDRTCQPLIVCASLVDRPPNLGGLARTCEVFRAECLAVADMRIKVCVYARVCECVSVRVSVRVCVVCISVYARVCASVCARVYICVCTCL